MASNNSSAGKGDQEAHRFFDDLHATTFRQVVAYCRRRAPTAEDADDAVAEAYVVAWRKLDEVRQADIPIAWMYGVARRILANQRRAHSRGIRLVELLGLEWRHRHSVDPADLVASRDGTDTILIALEQLSPIDRELIRLSTFEGLTNPEIGVVLNLRSERVRDRLYSARRRLETLLTVSQTSDIPHEVDTSGSNANREDDIGESGDACAQP